MYASIVHTEILFYVGLDFVNIFVFHVLTLHTDKKRTIE